MDRVLIIRVLETLEKNYPSHIDLPRLGREIEAKKFKISPEKLQPVINYLDESRKIAIWQRGLNYEELSGSEKIKILPAGIDYLTELKLLQQKEKSEKQQEKINQSISIATFALALAAFIDVGMSWALNNKVLRKEVGVYIFTFFFLFHMILFSFMAYLIGKSYNSLENN